jgi:hypothetical protein
MKQTTDIAIRNLYGRRDDLVISEEFKRFMEDVEKRYASGQNGQHQLAAECLPIWIELAKLKGIEVEAGKKVEALAPIREEKRGPGRPRKTPEPMGA